MIDATLFPIVFGLWGAGIIFDEFLRWLNKPRQIVLWDFDAK